MIKFKIVDGIEKVLSNTEELRDSFFKKMKKEYPVKTERFYNISNREIKQEEYIELDYDILTIISEIKELDSILNILPDIVDENVICDFRNLKVIQREDLMFYAVFKIYSSEEIYNKANKIEVVMFDLGTKILNPINEF